MKIGIIPINIGMTSAAEIGSLSQLAESNGIESVWTYEHVIVPVDYESKYPYSASGKMGARPETPFVDPLVALAVAAAHTRTLRLGTGVNILSQANPLYLAKQAASLDVVSGGRFMLGVGIGWLREEFAAMGVPFARRGARFDDYVAAMRKVWSGDVVEHSSAHLDWHGFKSYPLPVQRPFPVIVGGARGKVFTRIARHGNGWYAPLRDPAALAAALVELRAACSEVGRDFSEIEITAGFEPTGGLDAVRRMRDAGAHRLVTSPGAFGRGDAADGIKRLGDDIVGRLR
jgi:probable F420-dependent oxidoreductase